MPRWIVVTKNGDRVKLLESKLNQTLSNCAHLLLNDNILVLLLLFAHLIVVLGPSPLDIFPFSPSCSESCLIWQLFNLPSEESGHRDGLTGGRARVGEAQLDGRLGLPGSEVRCWQESVRTGLVFIMVNIMMSVAFSTCWSCCCNLCDTLILRLWRKL